MNKAIIFNNFNLAYLLAQSHIHWLIQLKIHCQATFRFILMQLLLKYSQELQQTRLLVVLIIFLLKLSQLLEQLCYIIRSNLHFLEDQTIAQVHLLPMVALIVQLLLWEDHFTIGII